MAFKTKTYDPANHLLYAAGNLIEGFAPDFIEITQVSDAFVSEVGADGEVCRVKTNDRRFRVKFKLMQSSSSNDVLSGLHNSDLNGPNGAGVGSIGLSDTNGTSKFSSDKAWIVKFPDQANSNKPNIREWEFETNNPSVFVGGN